MAEAHLEGLARSRSFDAEIRPLARPVFAGDRIAYRHRVSEKRVSRSRPGWGIIGFAVEAANQDDVCVMTFDGAAFLGTD